MTKDNRRVGLGGTANALLVLLCLLLALGATLGMQRANQTTLHLRLQEAADELARRIQAQLAVYEYGLRGLQASIDTVGLENYRRQHFLRYQQSRDFAHEFPGAHGFGIIRKVANRQTEAFVAATRADGQPGFTLRELSFNPGERWIIQQIGPLERNQPAVGLDIASESRRAQTIQWAVATGNTTLTQPLTLVQVDDKRGMGFLLIRPIYPQGMPLLTAAHRQAAVLGLTYAPLLVDETLASLHLEDGGLSIALGSMVDGPVKTFYATPGWNQGPADAVGEVVFPVYGRDWVLHVQPKTEFLTRLNLVAPKLVGGTVLTAGVVVLLLLNLWALARQRRVQIAQEQALLAAIVESSNEAVIGKTIDGVVTSWNRAAERMFGYSAEETMGKTIAELIIPPELVSEEEFILGRLRNGEPTTHFVTRRHRKDGQVIEVSVSVSPILGEDGRIVGAAKTVQDVTAQQKAAREIQRLNATLEQRVEERTRELAQARQQQMRMDRLASLGLMVAGVAHELNTPLGASMLTLDKLGEEMTLFRQLQASGLRKSDLERLLGQIDDGLAMIERYLGRSAEIIRQFKQVASDRASAERRAFSVNVVVKDVIHLIDSQIKKSHAKVLLDLPVDVEMDSYPGTFGQVLQNLVENALIHAFPHGISGTIEIMLRVDQAAARMSLCVRDNGRGIPEELREKIWDPFFTTRRGEGGTGLGLHIVQRLVTEILGGTVVQRVPASGVGAEFEVMLPLVAPEEAGGSVS